MLAFAALWVSAEEHNIQIENGKEQVRMSVEVDYWWSEFRHILYFILLVVL